MTNRPSDKFRVKDEGADQKYFAIVPRMVSGMSRDPFDLAVWVTIKEVAGEAGECWLSTESLAALAGMSVGKASQSRAYLIGKGLLNGEQRRREGGIQKVWHITIPDLWARNMKFAESYPKIEARIVYKRSLHVVKASCGEGLENPPSQENQASLHVVVTKNNHTKGIESDEGKPVGADAPAASPDAPTVSSSKQKKPRKARPIIAPDPRRQTAEIQLYREIVHFYPQPENYDAIIAALQGMTLAQAQPFFLAWLTVSGNRYSLTWLLEWMASGRPAGEFGAGAKRNGSSNGAYRKNSAGGPGKYHNPTADEVAVLYAGEERTDPPHRKV